MEDQFPIYKKPIPLLAYQKQMSDQIEAQRKANPEMKLSWIIKAVTNHWETRKQFKNKQQKQAIKKLNQRTDEEIMANLERVKEYAATKAEIKCLKLEIKKLKITLQQQNSELIFLRELIEGQILKKTIEVTDGPYIDLT